MAEVETLQSKDQSFDFSSIPVRALNVSCRSKLSLMLNPEVVTDKDGFNRDYRGLAELMGFEHDHIMSFMRESDPMAKMLRNWEFNPDSTVDVLFDHLKFLDRFDVIDQVKPLAERNAQEFLRRQANNEIMPVQVQEISSHSIEQAIPDDPNHLTLLDTSGHGPQKFDAYVCYADDDFEFVKHLIEKLESKNISLCIKDRDVLPSRFEDDSIIRIIEERCSRMLIIWSPEFSRSSQCIFLTKFATGLTIEQRKHKIIPVIYKPHPMPGNIKFLSKVDFSRKVVHCWLWDRLIVALKQGDSTFIQNHIMAQSTISANSPLPPPYQSQLNPPLYDRIAISNESRSSPIIQSPTPNSSLLSSSYEPISDINLSADSVPKLSSISDSTSSSNISTSSDHSDKEKTKGMKNLFKKFTFSVKSASKN